jgi:hypothetical protein
MIAYKLFRIRKDGSLGSLFINKSLRIAVGEWVTAESHWTEGYSYRPGWHAMPFPYAPHLSERGRQWFMVELADVTEFEKPKAQGGTWYLAKAMKVIGPYADLHSRASATPTS